MATFEANSPDNVPASTNAAHKQEPTSAETVAESPTKGLAVKVPAEQYGGDDVLRAGELAPLVDTAEHDALSQLKRWREIQGLDEAFPYADQVIDHFTRLTHSPEFRTFLEDARKPVDRHTDENWNVAWFGAEMFAAGVLAARRDFGRRPASPYDLALDLGIMLNPRSNDSDTRER